MSLYEKIMSNAPCDLGKCTNEQLYVALVKTIHDIAESQKHSDSKKKLYYLSAAFLVGKLLSNNLINLGIYEETKQILNENGKNLSELEEIEAEPSL